MAKRTTLVFEDDNLLIAVKEQALLHNMSMNAYIQDLIKQDLRIKNGYTIDILYEDGSAERKDLWMDTEVTWANTLLRLMIDDPEKFREDIIKRKYDFDKRPAAYTIYQHDKMLAEYPKGHDKIPV